jgi:hypothetical protein
MLLRRLQFRDATSMMFDDLENRIQNSPMRYGGKVESLSINQYNRQNTGFRDLPYHVSEIRFEL